MHIEQSELKVQSNCQYIIYQAAVQLAFCLFVQ